MLIKKYIINCITIKFNILTHVDNVGIEVWNKSNLLKCINFKYKNNKYNKVYTIS